MVCVWGGIWAWCIRDVLVLILVQVAKNFSEVFVELVPQGKAQLTMQRAVDGAPVRDMPTCTRPHK